jgi:inosine-uridine nucleoside N-ribohydrolase
LYLNNRDSISKSGRLPLQETNQARQEVSDFRIIGYAATVRFKNVSGHPFPLILVDSGQGKQTMNPDEKTTITIREIRKPQNLNRRDFLATSTAFAFAGTLKLDHAARVASRQPTDSAAPNQKSSGGTVSKVQRIIIDTDPGVDDAIAILLALRSPELKVEAITPVSGNVPLELTLTNALRLVEIAGRTDIPVAAGASHPLTRRLVTAKYAHGNNGLGGVDFPAPTTKPSRETANEIISRIVRESPGEITIVALGPLTNIATVLRSDPELAGMIRGIALMGGSLSGGNVTPSAEFNFYVDPEAARIVFDSHIPLTMVGLDVTRKVLLREDHIQLLEASKNPVSQAAARVMRATLERVRDANHAPTFAMHDPLTVASLIDPSILTLRDYYVEIETSGELTAGESVGYQHAPMRKSAPLETGEPEPPESAQTFTPNAKVAMEVDPERFFKLLIPRLTGSASS